MEEQGQRVPNRNFKLLISLLILPFVFVINNLLALFLSRVWGLENGLTFFAIATLSQHLLLIGSTMYLVLVRWDMDWSDLGLHWTSWPRAFWRGLVSGPLVFFVVTLGGVLVDQIHPIGEQGQPFTQMILQADSGPQLFLLAFLAVVLAPLAEELYFRGLLFNGMKDRLGLAGGIIISGLVFGLLHFDVLRFVPIALGGMVLAWLYHRSGSLYAPMTAHGVWNGLMLILLLLAQGG